MALSKKPVNGMKDILPEEMQIRDYVQQVIKETYRSFGFTPIETPCMENIANLSNKQGGENEKLIFKVMKRGEVKDRGGKGRGGSGRFWNALRSDGAVSPFLCEQR